MRINHNIAALNTYRQLAVANNAASKSMEKLSSGLRINRAGDDAAGLAISEKMRGQIRGLEMASKNAQDGISLIQTAEGALNETEAILQRMRELAVQASNDTNTDADRNEIQKEIEQLKDEINRISETTEFNTKKLLNGSVGNTANVTTDNHVLGSVQVVDSGLKADTYTLTTAAPATVGMDIKTNTTGLSAADFDLNNDANIDGLKLGDYTLEIKSTGVANTFDITLKNSDGVVVGTANGWVAGSGNATITGALPDGTATKLTLIDPGVGVVSEGTMTFNLNATYAAAGDFAITNSAGATVYSSAAGLKITDNEFEAGGLKFDLSVDSVLAAPGNSTIVTTNNALTMHIGANEGQTMKVDINKMDATSLGVKNVDVTSQTGAETAITSINNAIEKVSSERAKLGAFQNRLEHTINNLGTSSENLTAAESRIRDVDYALAA
ncbi:flagellin N-terminal helical domain-containing protein [Saccharococcus caldoxylosilyticus]|uniref:flagellin N-terminal helical domain-containing protein n=1 Tax=Saccharococcus caldoxylosilyticus TaxID=81408 RepID=UPI0002F1D3E9|nr:flagellin [Parageobacillus caldoxylosilyticus]